MGSRAEIGARIAAWRAARGVSLRELAQQADVPKSTIERIEEGGAASWWAVCAMLRALGADDRAIIELVRDSGDVPGV